MISPSASPVVGRRSEPPAARLVAFVGVQQVARELGRLPERQCQAGPLAQRIERAGVAGPCAPPAAGPRRALQRRVGAGSDRLVQQQDSVDRHRTARWTSGAAGLSRGPRRPTASLIRRSISKPRSNRRVLHESGRRGTVCVSHPLEQQVVQPPRRPPFRPSARIAGGGSRLRRCFGGAGPAFAGASGGRADHREKHPWRARSRERPPRR